MVERSAELATKRRETAQKNAGSAFCVFLPSCGDSSVSRWMLEVINLRVSSAGELAETLEKRYLRIS
jgi:hypothetical protein